MVRRVHAQLFGRTIFKRTQYGNWYLILPGYVLSSHVLNSTDWTRRTIRLRRRYRSLYEALERSG